MDIISQLPEEISHYIFKFLSVEELGRCFRVSKSWRNLANCDCLWKKHCLTYGVEEPVHNGISDLRDFCYWASIWRGFVYSPAYKWHTNKFETLLFNKVRSYYCCYACYKNYFVAYSAMFNCLDIYSVVKSDNLKCTGSRVKLITCIALCFPKTAKEEGAALFMTEEHIIIGKCNIVLVYKKINDNYELFKAMTVNFDQQFATRDISKFVEKKIINDYYIEIFGIIGNNLFINNVVDETSCVLNILTNEHKNIVCYDTCSIINKFFVTWTNLDIDDMLRVYDSNGDLFVLLDHIPCIEEVTANDTLLCVQRGEADEEGILSQIDVWELETGRVQFSTKTALNTWVRLHPSKEILYFLEDSRRDNIYKITAWDLRADHKLWVFDEDILNNSFEEMIITFWSLNVVCENYLIFWPLISGKDQYACIDSRNGKCLYKGTKLARIQELNYITDSLWLSVSGENREVLLKSYL